MLYTHDKVPLITGMVVYYVSSAKVAEPVVSSVVSNPNIEPVTMFPCLGGVVFSKEERAHTFLNLIRQKRKEAHIKRFHLNAMRYNPHKEV